MYKAIYELAFATDGSVSEHMFEAWDGVGVAFSKSPKRAIQLARRDAFQKCGQGACWVPIHAGGVLLHGTNVVSVLGQGLWFTKAV